MTAAKTEIVMKPHLVLAVWCVSGAAGVFRCPFQNGARENGQYKDQKKEEINPGKPISGHAIEGATGTRLDVAYEVGFRRTGTGSFRDDSPAADRKSVV